MQKKRKSRNPRSPVQQSSAQLPEGGLVRLSTILKLVPVGRSTWWAGVRDGRYPKPTKALGPRITAWTSESIRALIERGTV